MVTIVSTPPDPDAIRVGTQEREDAVRILGDHFAAGRLPMDEYEQRVSAAVESATRADLRALFRDLPAPHPAFMAPPPAPLPPPYVPAVYPDRSRVVAGVLQLVVPFGIGRFYLGDIRIAVAQLLLVFVGVGVIWSLIDGVLLLVGEAESYGRPRR